MKIRSKLSSAWHPNLGLLLLRLAVGIVFLLHGIGKLGNMAGTTMFFESLGMNAFMAWLVAIIETVGGAFLILGVWTSLAGLLIAIIMVGAYVTVKIGKPFVGGYEFEAVLFLASLAISFLGAGKYALLKSKGCDSCKDCNCSCHPGDKRCGSDGKCVACKCD